VNWRLILSHSRTVDALATSCRIVLVASVLCCGWFGYRLYTAASSASKSHAYVKRSVAEFQKLRSEFERQKLSVGSVSRRQLECDAPAQFASQLGVICGNEGVRITQLQTDTAERIPLDNLEGGGPVEGWKSLGHTIELVGPCKAVHNVLASLEHLPMPFELTYLEVKRVGLTNTSSGSLLQASLLLEVYEPGAPGAETSTGGTTT
jgi:hypothetical protein